ncbi:MAG: hypothetical protein KAJ54_02475 [Candidatus Aenigmarchaeota archaeon]|nr:hypothetical protein [Candidatus Aenigmarchaeota archaeon]
MTDFEKILDKYDRKNPNIYKILRDLKNYINKGDFKRNFSNKEITESKVYIRDEDEWDNCADILLSGLKDTLDQAEYKTVLKYVADEVWSHKKHITEECARNCKVLDTNRHLLSTEYYDLKAGIHRGKKPQNLKNKAYNTCSDKIINLTESLVPNTETIKDINLIEENIKYILLTQSLAIPNLKKTRKCSQMLNRTYTNFLDNNPQIDPDILIAKINRFKKNHPKIYFNKGLHKKLERQQEVIDIVNRI